MAFGQHLAADIKDAIANGQGAERPIRCPHPDHFDNHASASVNVLKLVWYCYSCHKAGKVDSKAAPKAEDLLAMMNPETAGRTYSPTWLEWFTSGDGAAVYWQSRFEPWVCRLLHMGSDPLTGDATYPVHTPEGRLAGVGRRLALGEQKYKYPYGWAASRSLAGYVEALEHSLDTAIVVLVEGKADQAALLEVGATAFAVYGSGVHLPQIELINRLNPKLILLGFDSDNAGRDATLRTQDAFEGRDTAVVDWLNFNDPADAPPAARIACLNQAVVTSPYSHAQSDPRALWETTAKRLAA